MAERTLIWLFASAALALTLTTVGWLPQLSSGTGSLLLSSGPLFALAVVALTSLAQLTRQTTFLIGLAAASIIAAAILVGADSAAPIRLLPTLLAAISLGLLFARFFNSPALVVALPLLIVGVDLLLTLTSSTSVSLPAAAVTSDPLILQFPLFGSTSAAAAQIPTTAFFFAAILFGYANLIGWRLGVFACVIALALLVGTTIEAIWSQQAPYNALVCLAFLLTLPAARLASHQA